MLRHGTVNHSEKHPVAWLSKEPLEYRFGSAGSADRQPCPLICHHHDSGYAKARQKGLRGVRAASSRKWKSLQCLPEEE